MDAFARSYDICDIAHQRLVCRLAIWPSSAVKLKPLTRVIGIGLFNGETCRLLDRRAEYFCSVQAFQQITDCQLRGAIT